MARSRWPEPASPAPLDRATGVQLIDIADRAIVEGLDGGDPPTLPERVDVAPALWRPAGSFVTLHVGTHLNGCIGTIEASEPLARDIVRHACSAAFADPRLPPLRSEDYDDLSIEISILSSLAAIPAGSRAALLDVLRRDVDGLLIEADGARAVFLPAVWATLPVPDEFLSQLLRKAGLDPGGWPIGMRAWRFTAQSIADPT